MFTSTTPPPLLMKHNMGKINILFQSFEITELTLIQDIRHVLDSMFILEMYFVGGALYGGVGTVRTVVRSHS